MQLISPAGVEAELAMFYACPSSITKMFEHARNDMNRHQCLHRLSCYLLAAGGWAAGEKVDVHHELVVPLDCFPKCPLIPTFLITFSPSPGLGRAEQHLLVLEVSTSSVVSGWPVCASPVFLLICLSVCSRVTYSGDCSQKRVILLSWYFK